MKRRIAPALIILALVASACAQRDAVLSRTIAGLDAAQSALVASDERVQRSILAKATTNDEAKANLAKYRGARDAVLVGIEAAYAAVFVAALEPNETAIANLLAAAGAALQLFNDFREATK